MPIYRKNGTSWQGIANVYRKSGTTWQQIKSVYRKVGTTWTKVFSGLTTPKISKQVEISDSIDGTTYLITLTGKNYPWTGADTLTYEFERSTDGISFVSPAMSSGSITNPTVSNTKTHTLTTAQVIPNVTNTFRFSVTGVKTSNNATAVSSATLTVDGVTDITVSNTGQGIGSLTFAWTGGLNASGFIYQYQTYVSGVGGGWSSQVYTANSSVTISGLDSNKDYQFRVKGVTGASVSNPGYSGNFATATGKTEAAPEPIVSYYPAILGTPTPGSVLNKYAGSYSNLKSGTSVETAIIATVSDSITQGQLPVYYVLKDTWEIYSPSVPESTYTYTVTQSDATSVVFRFYAVDRVTAMDGTYRYYYSNKLTAYIDIVTDDFNRTVSGGIGQMSSGYYYTGPYTAPTWSVNGSQAISAATPSFSSSPASWGLRSVEMSGKTDVTVSIKTPAAVGGLGVAFWVSAADSWWASTINNYSETTTSSTCTGTQITTDANGTGCGGCTASGTESTSYTCDGTAISATGTSDPACQGCTASASTTYPCGTADTYTSLVDTGSSAGDRCGTYTTGSTESCGGAYYSYSNGTLSTACGGKCSCNGPYGNTYGCGDYVYNRTACGSTAGGVYNSSTVGLRCGSCFGTYPNYYYQTVTYTPTYYTCQVRSCATTYTYSKRTTSTTYSCKPKANTTTTYKCNPSVSTSETTYKVENIIWSMSGSAATIASQIDVSSSTTSYATVWGIRVNTSGNTIYSRIYSDSSLSTQLGDTHTYTPSNPTKSLSNGYSAAGIVKGPADVSGGNAIDNFIVY
jgi:hypothetical protein